MGLEGEAVTPSVVTRWHKGHAALSTEGEGEGEGAELQELQELQGPVPCAKGGGQVAGAAGKGGTWGWPGGQGSG